MAKPELGTKRVCPTTGRKFYDLNKDPIVSPYTGQSFPRSVFEPQAKAGAVAKPAPDEEEAEVEESAVEIVSLDEAEAESTEKEAVVTSEDDIEVSDDEIPSDDDEDDTFLEEDEEDDDDVSDLIDGDIDTDEDG